MTQLFQKAFNSGMFFLALCFVQSHYAQISVLKNDEFSVRPGEVNIKIINNTILLPIELPNNMRLYFILDTGASTTIITEPIISKLVEVNNIRKINVRGYGDQEPISAVVASGFSFKLNDYFHFENIHVIILDHALNLDLYLGEPVYGIIGHDLFGRFEVTIDFQRSKLYIKKPKSTQRMKRKERKKKISAIDLEIIGTKPYMNAIIKQGEYNDTLRLLLDTGFSGALSMYPKQKTAKYIEEPNIKNYLGYGMNGNVKSTFKQIEAVELGNKINFKNVSTNFLDSTAIKNVSHTKFADGSIGNDILKRFLVTFDYEHSKLYLKPIYRYFSEPFYYNLSGLRLIEVQNDKQSLFIIDSIRKGSEAEKAGLKEGDVLIEINQKIVKNLTITKVYKLLNDFTTTKRSIKVLRKDEQYNFEFILKPIESWN